MWMWWSLFAGFGVGVAAASEFSGGAEANARVTDGIKRVAVAGDGKGGIAVVQRRVVSSRSLSFGSNLQGE